MKITNTSDITYMNTYENTFIIDNNSNFHGYANRIDDIVVVGDNNGWTITSPKKLANPEMFRRIQFGSRIHNGNIVALMWESKLSFQDLENYYQGTLSLQKILKMLKH
jgi:hypothetical protein